MQYGMNGKVGGIICSPSDDICYKPTNESKFPNQHHRSNQTDAD